jgi:hypothetical protein
LGLTSTGAFLPRTLHGDGFALEASIAERATQRRKADRCRLHRQSGQHQIGTSDLEDLAALEFGDQAHLNHPS